MRITPVYNLPALDATSTGKDVYEQSWNIALALERILLNTGKTPIGGDVQTLLRRTADTGWITVPASDIGPTFTVRPGLPVRYRRYMGIVFLSGQLVSAAGQPAPTSGQQVFTLPVGFRPEQQSFAGGVLGWGNFSEYLPDGRVSVTSNQNRTNPGSTGYPLDGASFLAAPQ